VTSLPAFKIPCMGVFVTLVFGCHTVHDRFYLRVRRSGCEREVVYRVTVSGSVWAGDRYHAGWHDTDAVGALVDTGCESDGGASPGDVICVLHKTCGKPLPPGTRLLGKRLVIFLGPLAAPVAAALEAIEEGRRAKSKLAPQSPQLGEDLQRSANRIKQAKTVEETGMEIVAVLRQVTNSSVSSSAGVDAIQSRGDAIEWLARHPRAFTATPAER